MEVNIYFDSIELYCLHRKGCESMATLYDHKIGFIIFTCILYVVNVLIANVLYAMGASEGIIWLKDRDGLI